MTLTPPEAGILAIAAAATAPGIRSITPDGEYNNSYTCTGDPGLVTTLGMLTWAQHAITHSAYHPTGDPDD